MLAFSRESSKIVQSSKLYGYPGLNFIFCECFSVVTDDYRLQIQIKTTEAHGDFFSFSPEFSIKERRNNFRTLQTSRAAVLTYLDWLVPLKFLFGFDNDVVCLIM